MENLHKWVFAYNGTTEVWDAVKKENYFDLTNNRENVLSSASISSLISLIEKTDGNLITIDNLLTNKMYYENKLG